MKHLLSWFEIPTTDLERAAKFYSALLEAEIKPVQYGPYPMAFFPWSDDVNIGGALVTGEEGKPSADGVIIYFHAGDELTPMLERAEKAGGKVVMPKTKISDEVGYIAKFTDSEGNTIALHSKN